ncbi:MAG: transposase [bacterium]
MAIPGFISLLFLIAMNFQPSPLPSAMTTRYQDTAHARYLTFGCYRRKHLFSHPELADLFVKKLDRWRNQHSFRLWAYVVMPNHVHLLIHDPGADLGKPLSTLKRSFALDAMEWLPLKYPVTYAELEAMDHGKTVHRFWQTGGGYDRNVFTTGGPGCGP